MDYRLARQAELLEAGKGPPDWLFMGYTFPDEAQGSLAVVHDQTVELGLKSGHSNSRTHVKDCFFM
jgi:hypothetical protein